MGEGDGVYYSGSAYSGTRPSARTDDRRSAARRAKKAAVAVVGLSAVGGGAYFATTLLSGNPPGYVSGGPAALAPVAPTASPSPSSSPSHSASPTAPSPGPQAGTRNGARQSSRPSPTPSIPDDDVAAAEVSRLLQASPQPARPGMVIASGPVTVSTETGTDGSSIRVVAARYDLTGRWSPLSPGDGGRTVGDAKCTRKLAARAGGPAEDRPTMLMCWRIGPAKSVVTVAIRAQARPLAGASVDVLDRNWAALG
jgi:hypothetical protein